MVNKLNMSKLIDISGNKYAHLTVISRGEDLIKKNGKREPRWICRCDCGNPDTVLVLGYNLKNGNTTSCGCEHRANGVKVGKKTGAINGKKNKKYNKYDLSGEYGIGYTLKNEPFYFDLEDYELIKDICWHINGQGYVANKNENEVILMHRLIMGLGKGDEREVDHIYHNKNDNRKEKLRIVNRSQNSMNRDKPSNNTSGIKGVWFHKQSNTWVPEISINNNKYKLGCYQTIQEAEKIRKQAEQTLFQEYNYAGTEEVMPL